MSDLADRVLHVFLPNRCMFCGSPVNYNARRCPDCDKNAARPELSRCLLCGREECCCETAFDWLLAPFYYEMGAEKAIGDLKFNENLLNARKLGGDMADCLRKSGLHKLVSVMVPVPMYPKDQRKRGYNQAEELSRWIERETSIPLLRGALVKVRRTEKQHELGARQRSENLKGAFAVKYSLTLQGKGVLLVDDVFTTGSTMGACAVELRRAGASMVICLAAAKTRKHEPAGEEIDAAPQGGDGNL